jgi:hypothetical protein
VFLRKKTAGSTSLGHTWHNDGDVVEVPDEDGYVLLRIADAGFEAVTHAVQLLIHGHSDQATDPESVTEPGPAATLTECDAADPAPADTTDPAEGEEPATAENGADGDSAADGAAPDPAAKPAPAKRVPAAKATTAKNA